MFSLPLWEPYLELFLSISVLIWVCFLLFVIFTSQLNSVIRALLCTNTLAVLVNAAGQFSLALWCIYGNRPVGLNELHFFLPVILHQIGYYMCACSFLLITIERLVLCYKPRFHEKYHISFTFAFIISLLIEMSMVLPAIFILQYEQWTLLCAIFMGFQEFITFLLLNICYRKSLLYYRTKFATVNLNSRFEVRGVIELTRAFIPIISAGLSVKTLILILTLISTNGHEDFSVDAHFLLRTACTIYSLAFPFLLIFPVKTLRRRFHSFCFPFISHPIDIQPPIRTNADEATQKYFDELLKQWH